MARRWALVTIFVTGVVVYGGSALLRFDLGSTTVSFVVFGGLFGGTAWFVGAEVARSRTAPPPRQRYVCAAGHWSYAEGVCDCGLRRKPYEPPDMGPFVKRSVGFGVALLVAMVAVGLLSRGR